MIDELHPGNEEQVDHLQDGQDEQSVAFAPARRKNGDHSGGAADHDHDRADVDRAPFEAGSRAERHGQPAQKRVRRAGLNPIRDVVLRPDVLPRRECALRDQEVREAGEEGHRAAHDGAPAESGEQDGHHQQRAEADVGEAGQTEHGARRVAVAALQ